MNFDSRDADIRAILGSYSEVVTDGDPVLKPGAGKRCSPRRAREPEGVRWPPPSSTTKKLQVEPKVAKIRPKAPERHRNAPRPLR